MHIELCIPDRYIYLAVQPIFDGMENVTVSHESIVSGEYPALIVADNSFGDVSKGVKRLFGDDVANEIRLESKKSAGKVIVFPVEHLKYKWLVYAPIPNSNSDAQFAFRGALKAMRIMGITAASTELFCTENGFMGVVRAARLMRAALA
jgi:hypothetical protein